MPAAKDERKVITLVLAQEWSHRLSLPGLLAIAFTERTTAIKPFALMAVFWQINPNGIAES